MRGFTFRSKNNTMKMLAELNGTFVLLIRFIEL